MSTNVTTNGRRDSSVSIETRLRAGRAGLDYQQGQEILFFFIESGPALRPNRPFLQFFVGKPEGKNPILTLRCQYFLVAKTERKRSLRRPSSRLEDKIKIRVNLK
jgi:hypothetical protein